MKNQAIKLIFPLMLILLSSTMAMSTELLNPNAKITESARAVGLMDRLVEIKESNISSLSRIEKKELRREVKGIEKELKKQSDGIYISVGAIIIILLILILI
jgi:hypothetical protein